MQRGRYVVYVQPILTFVSRSEDRCWTCLTPPEARTPIERTVSGFAAVADGVDLAYKDLGRSWLSVRDSPDAGLITLEAISKLNEPVFSHLNTFAQVEFAGHQDLMVTFSPCPDQRIAVVHSDYPTGAPARFAYFDEADGKFCVREAASGEKGPFVTLAEGKMKRGDPLTMTLYDQDRAVSELTLHDWAAQAGMQLSPTAGYGLPVNAIEFSIDGDSDRASAGMWITLAATSVGRGWDSVGHAAGTYRNRVTVRRVDEGR